MKSANKGTPEQDLLEAALLEIERKPPGERTPEEAAQMEVIAAWFTDAGHVWGCPRYADVGRKPSAGIDRIGRSPSATTRSGSFVQLAFLLAP
jgi:hypothetical protein